MIHRAYGDAANFSVGALVHIVNNQGHIGGGFSGDVIKKWPIMEQVYRESQPLILGQIQPVRVDEYRWVINMIAQHGRYHAGSLLQIPPIRYAALAQCLTRVDLMLPPYFSISMPRIGAGLAGGDWNRILDIIKGTLADRVVRIYTLEGDEQ